MKNILLVIALIISLIGIIFINHINNQDIINQPKSNYKISDIEKVTYLLPSNIDNDLSIHIDQTEITNLLNIDDNEKLNSNNININIKFTNHSTKTIWCNFSTSTIACYANSGGGGFSAITSSSWTFDFQIITKIANRNTPILIAMEAIKRQHNTAIPSGKSTIITKNLSELFNDESEIIPGIYKLKINYTADSNYNRYWKGSISTNEVLLDLSKINDLD